MSGEGFRWAVTACVALLDFIIARYLGIHVVIELWFVALVGWLLAIYIVYRFARPDARLAWLCGSVAQYLALGCTLTILSCLVAAFNFPLIDRYLAKADATIGFDWLAAFDYVQSNPWLKRILQIGYNSTEAQTALLFLVLNVTGRVHRTGEFISLCAATLAIMAIISAVLPATGAWPTHRVLQSVSADYLSYLPLLNGLRDGSLRQLSLSNIDGIVTFPSFHTALGIIFVYTARGIPLLFPALAALNVIMISATPVIGGHYFVDIIAGAVITCAVIFMVRAVAIWDRAQLTLRSEPSAP
ncbi:hypothetical protein ACVIHI_001487 [Bradyrhizobium sp. USDA 4524]|uniref:phosphatase PAP2 family protein n=1 Tax=unclassified Bradyrhizobium TaxID=2631580 RepID=UPI0020A1032A|nr:MULTISPECIES: phosphatase PAP2 family protein [unclassified Bradyrhizobium]MCP1837138.1 hypothetical protein [Bradyrhizobium sp. USDA 4538]MCP1906157.1 hypothetical protein [Bradyrhizobium sp. USDA 4537]MCP1988189.1 hypothetical protein [Bradyrhizobium sp. USDA 4539]